MKVLGYVENSSLIIILVKLMSHTWDKTAFLQTLKHFLN